MAAKLIINVIEMLYRAVVEQQEEVKKQEASVAFQVETNSFIDIQGLTGVSMEQAKEQLSSARGLFADLCTQLSRAIALWNWLGVGETQGEGQPWPEFSNAPPPNLTPAEQEPLVPRRPKTCDRSQGPKLYDPVVGTHARYQHQLRTWQQAPKVNNPSTNLHQNINPWSIQYRTHYGILPPHEQNQVNNGYGHDYPVVAPELYEPGKYHGTSLVRNTRNSSSDFSRDKDYDPNFWQKNLGRGSSIWMEPRRNNGVNYHDAYLSPRSQLSLMLRNGSSDGGVRQRNWRASNLPGAHQERSLASTSYFADNVGRPGCTGRMGLRPGRRAGFLDSSRTRGLDVSIRGLL